MLPDDNDVNDDGADNGNDNARDGHDCQELSAIAAEIKHSFLFLFFFLVSWGFLAKLVSDCGGK